jgi:hypothetical protein
MVVKNNIVLVQAGGSTCGISDYIKLTEKAILSFISHML